MVATAVGGILSILEDERTALLIPSGDACVMAFQIKRLFDSEELCQVLSQQEVVLAQNRHNPEVTAKQYINVYKEIIKQHDNK